MEMQFSIGCNKLGTDVESFLRFFFFLRMKIIKVRKDKDGDKRKNAKKGNA